jgi:hypothetical protein
MDVESPSLPLPQSQYSKGHNSGLLPYLQTFFSLLASPCPVSMMVFANYARLDIKLKKFPKIL